MARIKKKEHENLTEGNIEKVISLLEAEKPITKKQACEILNISYNTTRLNKIIESYKEEQERIAKKRAENRGKPASEYEIQTIIERFLDGDSISEIAKDIYRSAALVKEVIEKIGVPSKPVGANYTNYSLVPDKCMKDTFEIGELVWSTKRHGLAIVMRQETNVSDKDNKYYSLWVIEPIEEPSPYFPQYDGYGGYYDGSYAYDLASLEHLKSHGVDLYKQYRPYFSKWLK